jgi:hypothetical protein
MTEKYNTIWTTNTSSSYTDNIITTNDSTYVTDTIYTGSISGGTTGTIKINPYSSGNPQTFDVPREDMPTYVFVAGRMLTIGIIGSDAEVCFMKDYLRFRPGIISCVQFCDVITLSIEYKDEIYHYHLYNTWQDKPEGDLISIVQK